MRHDFFIYAIVSAFVLCRFSSASNRFNSQFNSAFDDLDSAEYTANAQSSVCTEDDNNQKIQCFRELPLSVYEVFEGEDVLMRCRVAHQKGKLQWAFKGKMLGFDRTIPTHPRMRMPGDPSIGDHSLFIENAKVSDSGTYECQLSPAASQPPRRIRTELLVLKTPSLPTIYQDGRSNSKNVTVSIRKDESTSYINLTCMSENGNPKPTFEWNVNNEKLQSIGNFRSFPIAIAMANDSASTLSIRTDQLNNNDEIGCLVSNAATKKRQPDKELSVSVVVIKRVLPGALRFTTNGKIITVKEGDSMEFSCLTDDPGEPPTKLVLQSDTDRMPIKSEWITVYETNSRSQATLRVPVIDKSWHNISIFCSGFQKDILATDHLMVTVFVKHGPTKLDLTVLSSQQNLSFINTETVYCKENQAVKLKCSTNSYFGADIDIQWFTKPPEQNEWHKLPANKEKVNDFGVGLKQYNSYLEVIPSIADKDISKHIVSRLLLNVICLMKTQEFAMELRNQIKLELFEPPSSPVITINDLSRPSILTDGESVIIRCSITGGHPTPNLHLLDERDKKIPTREIHQIGQTKVEYKFIAKPEDNNRSFRCMVYAESVLEYIPLSSDLISLLVAVPPKKIKLKLPDSTNGLKAASFVTIQCSTDFSYPEAQVEWWLHESCREAVYKNPKKVSHQYLRSVCKTERLSEQIHSVYSQSSRSTVSTITIKLTPQHDKSYIECSVAPYDKWTALFNRLSDVERLIVKYPPFFIEDEFTLAKKRIFTVEEGQSISIPIRVKADPSVNGFTWMINGHPTDGKVSIELGMEKFFVKTAHSDMMSNYSLIVENQLGRTVYSFFLNVTFAPKLLGPQVETVKVNPKNEYRQKVTIMCSAQANPFKENAFVYWMKEVSVIDDHQTLLNMLNGEDFFSVSKHIHCAKDHWSDGRVSINCISLGTTEIVSSFQILNVDHRYMGSYKCLFSNSVSGSSAVKTTDLVFQSHPVAVRNIRRSEFSGKVGSNSEVACYFVGFPVPSVKWYRPLRNSTVSETDKFSISIIKIHPGMIKAVLAIRDTQTDDFGKYVCEAKNDHGDALHSVILDRPRVPSQPVNITVTNVTDTSITIGWILGFNGGATQTVQLRWRLYDSNMESGYNTVDIKETEDRDVQFFNINDLQSQREYEVSVLAINRYTTTIGNSKPIIIKTMKYDSRTGPFRNGSKKGPITDGHLNNSREKGDTNKLLIIILLILVGLLVLGMKVSLIVHYVRKRRQKLNKSQEKLASPTAQHMINGYIPNTDSLELRAPSLVRSGIESNLYPPSLSDRISHNGSDSGLKLNYYKTNSDEQFQGPYLSPEVDLVASAMRRNNYDLAAMSGNFHPGYIQLADTSSMNGHYDPYMAGYYTQRPMYTQNHARLVVRKPSHTSIDTTVLPQYPISTSYNKRMEKGQYPSSAVSISTASGDSNRSQSPPRKYSAYSPLIGQSTAPSTIEEYLSSANSGSECPKYTSDEYYSNPLTSFRLNQGMAPQSQPEPCTGQQKFQEHQESTLGRSRYNNMIEIHYHHNMDSQQMQRSTTLSDNEQILKPPIDFTGSDLKLCNNQSDGDKLNLDFVDLISHSSPSVIRIKGSLSEQF